MIGRKIGLFDEVFSPTSGLNPYILMGLFEPINLGGSLEDVQEEFLVVIRDDVNVVTFEKKDDRLIISLLFHDKTPKDVGNGKMITSMKNKHTFVIHYNEPGIPVYNSEY